MAQSREALLRVIWGEEIDEKTVEIICQLRQSDRGHNQCHWQRQGLQPVRHGRQRD